MGCTRSHDGWSTLAQLKLTRHSQVPPAAVFHTPTSKLGSSIQIGTWECLGARLSGSQWHQEWHVAGGAYKEMSHFWDANDDQFSVSIWTCALTKFRFFLLIGWLGPSIQFCMPFNNTIKCSGIQNDRDTQNPFCRHIYHIHLSRNVRSGNRNHMRRGLQKVLGKILSQCLSVRNNFWDVTLLLLVQQVCAAERLTRFHLETHN
jgi:hypothetical protein